MRVLKLILQNWHKPLLLCALCVVPAVVLFAGTGEAQPFSLQTALDSGFLPSFESYVLERFPSRDRLDLLQMRLRMLGGQREQRGVFIGEDTLLKQVDAPIDWYVRRNTEAIRAFSQEMGINAFLMLIPTASTISQEKLPSYAYSQMVNQTQFIENVYNELSGRVTVIDVYAALFNHRSEYLYYRTENALTSLGGYYVYSAMGSKLGIESRALEQFDILYGQGNYFGKLYELLPYPDVQPDAFPLFSYTAGPQEYTVTHSRTDGDKTYHTLYPAHVQQLGRESDIYLGGLSAIVDIRTESAERLELPALLVFGDSTATAYLPFLANHYQRITLLDLFSLPESRYEEILPEDYAQVLFAYSIETFMHSDVPMRVEGFID